MPRRLASTEFRDDQWHRRGEPYVRPFNDMIDALGTVDSAGHPPYIPAYSAGVAAPVLCVLRDPGPKSGGRDGSGFLGVENDDPTAERMFLFLEAAGMSPYDVVPWNAYPWYINKAPSVEQLEQGVGPLREVIDLLPRLRVVLLLGGDAEKGWKRFLRQHRATVEDRGIAFLKTFHTSRQALQSNDPLEREWRETHIRATMASASGIVRAAEWPIEPAVSSR